VDGKIFEERLFLLTIRRMFLHWFQNKLSGSADGLPKIRTGDVWVE
jgi:hypothetical protein